MARGPIVNPQITIEPNPNRVIVRLDGTVIADSTRALVMRAPGTPAARRVASAISMPRENQ